MVKDASSEEYVGFAAWPLGPDAPEMESCLPGVGHALWKPMEQVTESHVLAVPLLRTYVSDLLAVWTAGTRRSRGVCAAAVGLPFSSNLSRSQSHGENENVPVPDTRQQRRSRPGH